MKRLRAIWDWLLGKHLWYRKGPILPITEDMTAGEWLRRREAKGAKYLGPLPVLLLLLVGCNSTNGRLVLSADGRPQALEFSSWNFASDRSLALTTPAGAGLNYGSSTDTALASQMASLLKLFAPLIARVAPVASVEESESEDGL